MAEAKAKKKYEIERQGEKMILPVKMTYDEGIETLQRAKTYEEEVVNILEQFEEVAFWDGAYAFYRALDRRYGFVHSADRLGSSILSVPIGVDERVNIPWGKFKVPTVEGSMSSGFGQNNRGQIFFQIGASVRRKEEAEIRTFCKLVRQIAKEESIYKGKAIRLRFKDDSGDYIQMMEPQFMDVKSATPAILPVGIGDAVETSVFAPLQYTESFRKAGIPLKRGVLFSGTYGTGKTKTAHYAARLAEENGWTFGYCERADELEDTIRFVQQYSPGVVFCEDVDRITTGSRTLSMDQLLDIIDGIESKDNDLMVVLTTNNVGAIHKAMMRPGRLDDVIEFTRPDAETVERLIRFYAGNKLSENADLSKISLELEGQIPALIRECVERAKMSAIKLSKGEYMNLKITPEALMDASYTMRHQIRLLEEKKSGFNKHEALGLLLMGDVDGGRVHFDTLEKPAEVEAESRDQF